MSTPKKRKRDVPHIRVEHDGRLPLPYSVWVNAEARTGRDAMLAIIDAMTEAKAKAVDSLARYKFLMFGYHAAAWVRLNHLLKALGGHGLPNPFGCYVMAARSERARMECRKKAEEAKT